MIRVYEGKGFRITLTLIWHIIDVKSNLFAVDFRTTGGAGGIKGALRLVDESG